MTSPDAGSNSNPVGKTYHDFWLFIIRLYFPQSLNSLLPENSHYILLSRSAHLPRYSDACASGAVSLVRAFSVKDTVHLRLFAGSSLVLQLTLNCHRG